MTVKQIIWIIVFLLSVFSASATSSQYNFTQMAMILANFDQSNLMVDNSTSSLNGTHVGTSITYSTTSPTVGAGNALFANLGAGFLNFTANASFAVNNLSVFCVSNYSGQDANNIGVGSDFIIASAPTTPFPSGTWQFFITGGGAPNQLRTVVHPGEITTTTANNAPCISGGHLKGFGFTINNTGSSTSVYNMCNGSVIAETTNSPNDFTGVGNRDIIIGNAPDDQTAEFENTLGLCYVFNESLTTTNFSTLTNNGNFLILSSSSAGGGGDATAPAVNITNINGTTPIRFGDLLNISCYATDETALTLGNITLNISVPSTSYNKSFSLSGTSSYFSSNFTINVTRGNVINATCGVSDGTNTASNGTLITVANTVPSFSTSSISQTAPNTTTTLTGTTSGYSDADSDAESGSTYKWYKNTVVIGGETTTSLAGTNFIRNDAIKFEATPSDGVGSGSPVNSSSVTIVDSPPSFGLSNNNTLPKINYVVQLSANTTDNDILSMIIVSWNGSSTGVWINVSNTTASSTGLNYSVNLTVGLARGNTIGWLFYSNDSVVSTFTVSALTTFAVADTTPTFTLANNNTNARLNDVVQLSALVNDSDTLSMVIASWNCSSSAGTWTNISNITLSSTANNYSVNITNSLVRANTCGWLFYSNDTVSTFTPSALNTFVIANTVAPSTTISNGSEINVNTNITLNITGVTDADNDALYYLVYFEAINPPTVLVANYTTLNFTTNMTNDTIYFINISVWDGVTLTPATTITNITLDTAVCVWQESFVANGSFYRTSANITYNATDKNLFEVNTSIARTSGSIINTINFTNLTSQGGSYKINLTIDASAGDGLYNATRWCGDAKNRKKPMGSAQGWNVAKSLDNRSLQFNQSSGLQCNISYGTTNPAEKKFLPLTANVSLKMSITYKDDDYYKIVYEVVAPNTGFTSATEFICNQKIEQVHDNLAGHLLIGSGKEKLSYDAQDLIDSGFTVDTKISDDNTFMQVIKKSGIVEGAVVSYDPKADNRLISEQSAIIEIDTGTPQFFSLNLSKDGLLGNNSFISANILNFTFNVSDKNNGTDGILAYIDGIKNMTSGYRSNKSVNLTITFSQNLTQNFTILLEINDSAGNKINGSYLFGFAVDNFAPTFSHAYNRTVGSNLTIITTETSVNATIILMKDKYLIRGNFSHNASNGNWSNHTIPISSNETDFSYEIGKGNFTFRQVVGWKFYVYDIAGNLLDPIYTFTVGEPSSQPSESGGDDAQSVGTSGTGGFSAGGVSAPSEPKKPIEVIVPQVWLTEQSTPIILGFYKNSTLYDPLKIEFDFKPDDKKNNIIYENLTRHSTGNYTAYFYVSTQAEEGKYALVIKVTSSPTEILEIPFEIRKSNPIVEFAKERIQDVQRIVEKVAGTNKEKLTGWQIGLTIGGTIFAILMLIMFGILISRIGSKEKPKVKARDYY